MLQKVGFDAGFESRKCCTVADRVRQFIPYLGSRARQTEEITLFPVGPVYFQ